MVKVTVQNNGVFEIDNEKLPELLVWLSNNLAVEIRETNTIKEVRNNQFTGRTLITE